MQHIRLDPLADLCDILTPDTATICFYTFTCRLHFRMDIIMQHNSLPRAFHVASDLNRGVPRVPPA